MNISSVRRLTECAMLIALATALSLVKLVEMPFGGSVTAASMLPIVLLSYRHGVKHGMLSALVYAVLQQLLGLKTLSYVTGWVSIVAVIVLDYVLAFTVVGLAGTFRRRIRSQAVALGTGAVLACVLRYTLHTIAGATVWVGLSIPDSAALVYSIGYNAAYMIPEAVILTLAAVYVGGVVDFRTDRPVPVHRAARSTADRRATLLYTVGGLLVTGGVSYITLALSPYLQNEDGTFGFSRLGEAPLVPVLTVLSLCVLTLGALVLYRLLVGRRGVEEAQNM